MTEDMWNKVVWSDESKFNLFHSDSRTYIDYQKIVMRTVYTIQDTVKHGGGSVMVWGCICDNEKGILVQVICKMDRFRHLEILENAMIPSAWSIRRRTTSSCMIMHLVARLT